MSTRRWVADAQTQVGPNDWESVDIWEETRPIGGERPFKIDVTVDPSCIEVAGATARISLTMATGQKLLAALQGKRVGE